MLKPASVSILLVEDDEIMRLSLGDRLRLEGIPVRTVDNIRTARRELENGDIDLAYTYFRRAIKYLRIPLSEIGE